jgi:ABC-type lipoprotein release transport system permease subunit
MNHPHFLVFVVFMVMVMVAVFVVMVMVMVMVRRTLIVSFLDQAIRLVGHLCFLHRDDRIRDICQRCGLGQTYVAESGNENCRNGKSEFD